MSNADNMFSKDSDIMLSIMSVLSESVYVEVNVLYSGCFFFLFTVLT